jgi:hypothetical protein
MNERVNLMNLCIEITRRCNLECVHCLRGPAEDVTISKSTIDTLLDKVRQITFLTITGGEPSLACDEIDYLLKGLKAHNINPSKFYLVTNGQQNFSQLANIIGEGVGTSTLLTKIMVSQDVFHPSISKEVKSEVEKTPFADIGYNVGMLYDEGRARIKENSYSERKSPRPTVDLEWHELTNTIFGDLYLNAHGYLINGGCYSYATQDRGNEIICHISKLNMGNFRKGIYHW